MNKKQLCSILIVVSFVLFAAVETYFKNSFIVFLSLFAFAATRFFRRLSFDIITVMVFIVGLYTTSILGTVNSVKSAMWQFQNGPTDLINLLFTPKSGMEVLPPQVSEMLNFIEDYHLEDYRLSDQLSSNQLIYQRIVESAWPTTYSITSQNLFIEKSETSSCQLIRVEDTIALTKCD